MTKEWVHRPSGLLIVGMHRSGTSLVARLVYLHGATAPKQLLGPTKANEDGHWESQRVYDLNQTFLRMIGSGWNEWAPLVRTPRTDAARQALIEGGVRFLADEFSEQSLFALKDPRFCRLLPEWIESCRQSGADPRVILPLRNPLNVAASLEARDAITLPTAVFLWLRHALDAELASRGLPRAFVRYDDLLADWRGAMAEIATRLGVTWPDVADGAEAIVQNSRRHHSASDGDFDAHPDVHPLAKRTYRLLQRLLVEDPDPEAYAELDEVRQAFDDLARAVPSMDSAAAQALHDRTLLDAQLGRTTDRERAVPSNSSDTERHRMAAASSYGKACNICGNADFGSGPAGRLATTGKPPCCTRCGSLERHRALRKFYETLPIGFLSGRKALQFSPDLAIRPEWFAAYEISVYGGDNSLDMQKIDRPDGAFDFISLNHVIEFIPDARASFRELARVLSPTGIIQIGFSRLETRAETVDYDTPQSVHGYYHLFGLDYRSYLDLAPLDMQSISLPLLDDSTGASETFHFFARDTDQLVKIKMYSDLGR